MLLCFDRRTQVPFWWLSTPIRSLRICTALIRLLNIKIKKSVIYLLTSSPSLTMLTTVCRDMDTTSVSSSGTVTSTPPLFLLIYLLTSSPSLTMLPKACRDMDTTSVSSSGTVMSPRYSSSCFLLLQGHTGHIFQSVIAFQPISLCHTHSGILWWDFVLEWLSQSFEVSVNGLVAIHSGFDNVNCLQGQWPASGSRFP